MSDKRYIDIRFVFEERTDDFDPSEKYVELVKVKRQATDMSEHGEAVAERFAQTDFYWTEVCADLIEVFAGRPTRYQR